MMFFAFVISCQPLEKIGPNCMEICMETLTYEFTTPLESYSLTVSVATTEGEDVVEVFHVDDYISTFSEITGLDVNTTPEGFEITSEYEIDVDSLDIQINETSIETTDEVLEEANVCGDVCINNSYILNTDELN
jgi:hypothetical protein